MAGGRIALAGIAAPMKPGLGVTVIPKAVERFSRPALAHFQDSHRPGAGPESPAAAMIGRPTGGYSNSETALARLSAVETSMRNRTPKLFAIGNLSAF